MFVQLVRWWILLSTLATTSGWSLSALGMLNRTGYAILAVVVAVAIVIFRDSPLFSPFSLVRDFKKLRRRVRRFLPGSFAVLAVLVFVSGLIYAPNDHTGLSYRVSRTLQWLQHEGWVWIHTSNFRMNDRACGIEWLSAPLLLFLKSDRALFLLNFIPFLLMPGLIFSIWTRLGMKPRVAWSWMWLVPTGYCFLMQAGGIANDAFPTVYALAMVDFALRAWEGGKGARGEGRGEGRARVPWTVDFGLSLLSAALLVGAKASNLPLGLPWAVVFFPLIPKLWAARNTQHATRSTFQTPVWIFVLLVALVVSFIPTALLNFHYIHDWSGLSIERTGIKMKSPVAGVVGNAVLLVVNNFAPTFFPMAHGWNDHALSYFPGTLVRMMNANFEPGYILLGEMPTEDSSGIGFGISVLVLVSAVIGLRGGNPKSEIRNLKSLPAWVRRAALIAPWISLLAYGASTGMVTPGRLITPYYPLLFPLLLSGAGQERLVRRCWWRVLAGVVVLLALAALIVQPSRPLWPAKTILGKAVAAHPNQWQLARAKTVYEVYARRPDPLAGMRQWFPPELKVIGFLGTSDDLDISMWKPYGARRVERFLLTDPPEKIHELGIEYAVVSGLEFSANHVGFDEWRQRNGAELLESTNAVMTVAQGPMPFYLVRFNKPARTE